MPHFRPESIISSVNYDYLEVNQADYPWLNIDNVSIPTCLVALSNETSFRFGSIIGLHRTIEKIASSVSAEDSSSAQTALFMGLPYTLEGQPTSGISKVENSSLPNGTLFIASRNLVSASGLIFAILKQNEDEPPTVLRAGISTAKQRQRLLGAMGIRQAGGKRRQS